MSAISSVAELAGLWKREINYEPRDVVADSAERDASTVYWAQAPSGEFVDVRHVRGEGFVVRGFAGRCVVEEGPPPGGDPTAVTVTWHRHLDTKPESCPNGIDSAAARVVGNLADPTAQPVIMEEGDGYLEVWRRVAPWISGKCTVSASALEQNKEAPARLGTIQIAFEGVAEFFSDTARGVLGVRHATGVTLRTGEAPAQGEPAQAK